MYIGTDLIEKNELHNILDKIDFMFKISRLSLPYDSQWGIDYTGNYERDKLIYLITTKISIIDNNISVKSITANNKTRTVDVELVYNNKTLTTSLII